MAVSETVPPDNHTHTEWSWDAQSGSMRDTCVEAIRSGLPAIAFTEHATFEAWRVEGDGIDEGSRGWFGEGLFAPAELDVIGYLAAVDECRARFPELRILSGVELGEPHRHRDKVEPLVENGFDRVLGAVHTLRSADGIRDVCAMFGDRHPKDVITDYLSEVLVLVNDSDLFEVLAHIDFPVRTWPTETYGMFTPDLYEEEFRSVLRALASSGRVLEVNTQVPLNARIVQWWFECGGPAIAFGSDSHDPKNIAAGFRSAARQVRACGFSPGRRSWDFWTRT